MEKDNNANLLIYAVATKAAVAGALNPVPLVGDVGILVFLWTGLLTGLAVNYKVDFDKGIFQTTVIQVIQSVGIYAIGTFLFIGILKYTGIGTTLAMIVNGALNFGFTLAVGKMYQNAWKNNKNPDAKDLEDVLKNVVDVVKKKLDKEGKKEVARKFKENIKNGMSRKDAVLKIIKELFDEESGEDKDT